MIVPVILCGGAGTRLWPASREDSPKPFLALVDGASTLGLTLARIADSTVYGEPVIVAGADQAHLVAAALTAAKAAATVLLEPAARDTAAAIAAAAVYVEGREPGAVLLVLAADHVIRDVAGFTATVRQALPAAEQGKIVVFGIKPGWPSTGFGYIRPGDAIPGVSARSVGAFVEKPDASRAEKFVASGHLWNSGMFMLSAKTALAEMERHAPAVAAAARAAVAAATTENGVVKLAAEPFLAAPKVSIDYAIMEKTDRAAVVEAGFDWSDLGTWSSVWDSAGKDPAGNVAVGDAVLLDVANSYVSTDRPKIGVVGLSDIMVVATDDAVLVAHRDHADRVKTLVASIDNAPERVIGDFARHYRPWGYYQTLDLGKRHQVKRIVVKPGARLSLQKHFHRAEHWTVVDGVADVTVGMEMDSLKVTRLQQNEAIEIPLHAIHRMANPGDTPMTLIEVQVGDYLGEDDIVRLQDDYGRSA